MTTHSEQIWAYLHNELAPEEKDRFEQALHSDPHLREALDACRETHQELESILPLLDGEDAAADDQLEERLLAEWEAEHPEYAETPIRRPRRKILYFSLPLAAAAAAVILLSLSLQTKPIHWQRTAYGTAPQLRGQPEMQPHYTRTELKQINRELQKAIEIHIEQLPVLPDPWKLKIYLQELANGALSVEISGHPRADPVQSTQWNRGFQSLEIFRESIPLLGKQVADDLAGQNGP